MKCKDCDYWGGSDSTGDYRKCYKQEWMATTPPETKHADETCEWKNNTSKEGE